MRGQLKSFPTKKAGGLSWIEVWFLGVFMKKIDWRKLGRVAVFIDAANLESSVKHLGWWIDYKKLYDLFKKQTRLVGVRHYGVRFGNPRHDKFLTVLKRTGIKLITKPLKVIRKSNREKGDIRKANFDVEIAIDAVKLISSYDALVLFSGDSDFEALVKTLRGWGKKVLVVSTKHYVSRELIESCSRYIDLRKIKEKIVRRE